MLLDCFAGTNAYPIVEEVAYHCLPLFTLFSFKDLSQRFTSQLKDTVG